MNTVVLKHDSYYYSVVRRAHCCIMSWFHGVVWCGGYAVQWRSLSPLQVASEHGRLVFANGKDVIQDHLAQVLEPNLAAMVVEWRSGEVD